MKSIGVLLIIFGSAAAVAIALISSGHWMAGTILFVFVLASVTVQTKEN